MLLVVYLYEAERYTVVPEEFVFQLNERSLKMNGVNTNQNRRIYFSTECFEILQQNGNVEQFKPNFNLPITKIYPLPDNLMETCFYGRMYCFEGKNYL